MMRGSENKMLQAELNTELEEPSIPTEERKEIIERFRSYLTLLRRWARRKEPEEVSFPTPRVD